MSNKKFRWSKVYESSEEELIDFLQSRNIQAERIATDELVTQSKQTSGQDRTIWCAEGSLTLQAATTKVSLQPGDAIVVSAHTPYELLAGMTGYVCYVSN